MKSVAVVLVFTILSSVTALGLPTIGSIQSAAVRGRLLCNGKPYKGAKVKLWDIDTTDIDDLMAEGLSDVKGEFRLTGSETEITTIDPKLNIYHNCNDEATECLRKVQIIIPQDFVTQGPSAAKTFDVGILNLSGQFPGESRDCIN